MRRLEPAQLLAGNKVGAVRSAPGPEPAIADPQTKSLDVAPELARRSVQPHQVEGFRDGHEEGFSQIQGPMDMTFCGLFLLEWLDHHASDVSVP